VQSIPFIAAAAIGALEHSRFNDFLYWRSLETKLAELLPIARPAVVKAPAAPAPTAPVTNSEPVP